MLEQELIKFIVSIVIDELINIKNKKRIVQVVITKNNIKDLFDVGLIKECDSKFYGVVYNINLNELSLEHKNYLIIKNIIHSN